MLTRLTTGLKIIATKSLPLYVTANNSLQCFFTPPPMIEQTTTLHVSVYVTGDLTFQATKEDANKWCETSTMVAIF